MKHRLRFSLSAFMAGLGVYRELWEDIPGTGQSVMGLVQAGWGRLEIAHFFPLTVLNWILVISAVALAGWTGIQHTITQ